MLTTPILDNGIENKMSQTFRLIGLVLLVFAGDLDCVHWFIADFGQLDIGEIEIGLEGVNGNGAGEFAVREIHVNKSRLSKYANSSYSYSWKLNIV